MSEDHVPSTQTRSDLGERRPMVFVMYIHDSDDHKNDVLRFATFLRDCGIDAHLDRWNCGRRQNWYHWAIALIQQVDFVIVVASPLCRRVGDGQMPSHANLGGQSEMSLLIELQQQDRDTWTRKILPVLLPGHTWAEIPLFLQGLTADHYPIENLTPAGAKELLYTLTNQQPCPQPPMGPLIVMPPEGE